MQYAKLTVVGPNKNESDYVQEEIEDWSQGGLSADGGWGCGGEQWS